MPYIFAHARLVCERFPHEPLYRFGWTEGMYLGNIRAAPFTSFACSVSLLPRLGTFPPCVVALLGTLQATLLHCLTTFPTRHAVLVSSRRKCKQFLLKKLWGSASACRVPLLLLWVGLHLTKHQVSFSSSHLGHKQRLQCVRVRFLPRVQAFPFSFPAAFSQNALRGPSIGGVLSFFAALLLIVTFASSNSIRLP